MNGNHDADQDPPEDSRLRWMLGLASVLFVGVLVVWWPGCRQYPAVTSKESLDLIKLLYSACNTKDPVRLKRVEQGVETLTRDGKMSPAEQAGFNRILSQAQNGEWELAERAALQFAQDQLGQGSTTALPREQEPPRGKPRGNR